MKRVGLLYPYPNPLSPQSWSGTPRGLADGLVANGVEVVPIGAKLPPGIRQTVAALSRAGGRRGPLANRGPIAAKARTWEVTRRLRAAGPLDALIAMDTEAYDLEPVVRRGLPEPIPVTTYDDGTFALFRRHPDADITLAGIPARDLDLWVRRQGAGCRAASICCVSTSWAAASIVDDYSVPSDRVKVVGMGHRPRSTEGAIRDWSSPKFLFVGVEWGRKNGAAVLSAFNKVRESFPNATLDLVGEHSVVTDEGVRDHGLLRRDDPEAQRLLDSLFANATAFVLPSRFDPSPIAYLEAASAGLPVIATTEGGAGELLGDGAITVHPDDHDALLAGMLRLADPVVAQQLGAEAQRRAAESSWTKVTERMLEHLSADQDH